MLFPFIFKKAGMKMSVQKSGPGSPYSVNFILQVLSGKSFHFTGYPDFTVNSKLSGCVLRYSMKGIGEVQSPPGRSGENKTATLGQEGIYTVGQFGKPGIGLRKNCP